MQRAKQQVKQSVGTYAIVLLAAFFVEGNNNADADILNNRTNSNPNNRALAALLACWLACCFASWLACCFTCFTCCFSLAALRAACAARQKRRSARKLSRHHSGSAHETQQQQQQQQRQQITPTKITLCATLHQGKMRTKTEGGNMRTPKAEEMPANSQRARQHGVPGAASKAAAASMRRPPPLTVPPRSTGNRAFIELNRALIAP